MLVGPHLNSLRLDVFNIKKSNFFLFRPENNVRCSSFSPLYIKFRDNWRELIFQLLFLFYPLQNISFFNLLILIEFTYFMKSAAYFDVSKIATVVLTPIVAGNVPPLQYTLSTRQSLNLHINCIHCGPCL